MCALQFGYSVVCLVSSGLGSVIELLLAAHRSECYWQDAFMSKAERNLPKLKLFLLDPSKVSESIFLGLMEASSDAVWLLPFGFPLLASHMGVVPFQESGPCCVERQV